MVSVVYEDDNDFLQVYNPRFQFTMIQIKIYVIPWIGFWNCVVIMRRIPSLQYLYTYYSGSATHEAFGERYNGEEKKEEEEEKSNDELVDDFGVTVDDEFIDPYFISIF
jgi:hypothetical protein